MNDRKRPSAAVWITVALLVVLVGYPLSFGPVCWIRTRTRESRVWARRTCSIGPFLPYGRKRTLTGVASASLGTPTWEVHRAAVQ